MIKNKNYGVSLRTLCHVLADSLDMFWSLFFVGFFFFLKATSVLTLHHCEGFGGGFVGLYVNVSG